MLNILRWTKHSNGGNCTNCFPPRPRQCKNTKVKEHSKLLKANGMHYYLKSSMQWLIWQRMLTNRLLKMSCTSSLSPSVPYFNGLLSAESRRRPSSEWRLHADVLAARPELQAVLHCHPIHGTALACHDRGIPPFHYMTAVAGGDDIRCAPYATFGTQELSRFTVEAMVDRKACLLARHGLVSAGESLDQALSIAVEVETLARMYLQALQLGEPPLLTSAQMEAVHAQFRGLHYGQSQGRTQ